MITSRILRCVQQRRTKLFSGKNLTRSMSSDSSSSSDDDKKKKAPVTSHKDKEPSGKKSEEALKKLNLLLKQMVQDDYSTPTKTLDLAKPKGRSREKKEDPAPKTDIVSAAKDVAKTLGGDVKQTEYELLNKLLNPVTSQSKTTTDETKKSLNLSEVIAGMKIDRTVTSETSTSMTSKAYRVKQLVNKNDAQGKQQKSYKMQRSTGTPTSMEKIDLFGGSALGIFTESAVKYVEKQPELKTWDILHQRDLQLAITHPPENYFQEMILWTKQGKIWKFPIDNEQDMEEEKSVYFTEHVFLEKHLEGWCPGGPIRHFMELVCVGLSKNPYLSVQAKIDHINWFKEYFSSKEDILKEIGAIPTQISNIKQLDG